MGLGLSGEVLAVQGPPGAGKTYAASHLVRALLDAGFDPASPGLQILGYRQLVRHLRGETGLDKAVDEIKRHTRRLAKRQWTWFCRDMRVNWLEVTEDNNLDALAEIICNQVKEKLPLRENNIP